MMNKGRWLLFVLSFLLVAGCAVRGTEVKEAAVKTPDQLVSEAKAVIREVSIHDVKRMVDGKEKVIILDVRDKEEYQLEHIPGAVNMSRGLLDFHIQELIPDKTAKVVVY
jgi:3-mercaptopyruvate sulfurtransferase SseA